MTKHQERACRKKNELRNINSNFFKHTDMPVCVGIWLCEYRKRGWTCVTTSLFFAKNVKRVIQ